MTNEELAQLVYNGDELAKGQLYDNVYGLIYGLALSFTERHKERCRVCGAELDDFLVEGYFAMVDAVKAYCESDKIYCFNTFLGYPLKRYFKRLIGYDTKKGMLNPLNNEHDSFDKPIPELDGVTLGDTIEDTNANFADSVLRKITLSSVFKQAKTALKDNPTAYKVIYLEYVQCLSRVQIATKLGMSEQEVRSLKNSALRVLRMPKNNIVASYREEVFNTALHLTSLAHFKNTGTSSVEWAAEKLLTSKSRLKSN